MSTETVPAEVRSGAARGAALPSLTRSAPALLAAVSLAGLTAGSVLIVLMAAERPSTFTPTSAVSYGLDGGTPARPPSWADTQ